MSSTVLAENQAGAKEEKKVWRWRSKYHWRVTECQRAGLLHAPGCLFIFIAGNCILQLRFTEKQTTLFVVYSKGCLFKIFFLPEVDISLLILCPWWSREVHVRDTWAQRSTFFWYLLFLHIKICRFRNVICFLALKAQIFSPGFVIQQVM